jgi:hypothetical protein
MAKYGNEELGWRHDARDAASAAMGILVNDRSRHEVVIIRWDGKTDTRPDRQVEAFRLTRLEGSAVD